MTDPVLGQITVTEAVALQAKFDAVMAEYHMLGVALETLKGTIIKAVVTDPPPPVVEPEPPDPEPEPEPPTGDYGSTPPYAQVLDIGQFGDTPGDDAMHAWADHGGLLENTEIIGGQGSAVSNHNQGVPALIRGRNLLVRSNPKFGTDWLSQTANRDEEWENSTFTAEGTPFHQEGHGRYSRPHRRFVSVRCLNRMLYGNAIQLAYRPGAEAGGPVDSVFIDDRFEHIHAPINPQGHRSGRAGPVVALYGLGSNCDHSVTQDQLQDLFPQMGPSVTCVPEGAKDPDTGQMLPPWWTEDIWTDLRLRTWTRGKILSPVHQELYRVAGVRHVELVADLVLLDSGAPRILIDPIVVEQDDLRFGMSLYKVKPAESVRVDVTVRRPNGEVVPCPVEFMGKPIGTTADGVLTAGSPINPH